MSKLTLALLGVVLALGLSVIQTAYSGKVVEAKRWATVGEGSTGVKTLAEAGADSFSCTGPVFDVKAPADPHVQWRGPDDLPNGTVFNLRGETFHLRNSSNPDPDGACKYTGVGALPINKYPIRPGRTPNECVQGGRVVGTISLTADRAVLYCNSAAALLDSESPNQTLEGMRIDRAWDGARIGQAVCTKNRGFCHNVIRDVWISNVRDDCIENDFLGGLLIQHSLLDGCFAGISSDLGSSPRPSHADTDEIRLEGVLLRLQAFPYNYPEGGSTASHVGPFKIHKTQGPKIVVNDSIIAFEYYDTTRHGHWSVGWRKLKSCRNNLLLWLSDAPFPSPVEFPMPPTCFKIVIGAKAQAIWNKARNEWIDRHPEISRIDDDPPPGP